MIVILIFLISSIIFNYEINHSDSLINDNSKIFIDSNDSDYVTNSILYKNYNGSIEIINNIHFEFSVIWFFFSFIFGNKSNPTKFIVEDFIAFIPLVFFAFFELILNAEFSFSLIFICFIYK